MKAIIAILALIGAVTLIALGVAFALYLSGCDCKIEAGRWDDDNDYES